MNAGRNPFAGTSAAEMRIRDIAHKALAAARAGEDVAPLLSSLHQAVDLERVASASDDGELQRILSALQQELATTPTKTTTRASAGGRPTARDDSEVRSILHQLTREIAAMRARADETTTKKKEEASKEAMRKALVKQCRDVLEDAGATDEEKEKARLMLRGAGEDAPDDKREKDRDDDDDDEPRDSRDGEDPGDEKALARAIARKMGGAPQARGIGSGNLSEARRILARNAGRR